MATKSKTQSTSPIETGLLAVVGAGDYAAEQLRAAAAALPAVRAQFEARVSQVQADVQKRVGEFDPKTLQAQAQEVPNNVAATLLQTVSKAQIQAEATYEDLAERGGKLIERVRSQQSTKVLVDQANSTLARTKAAVTTARKAADDTASAIRGTITTGRREATTLADVTEAQAETAVKKTRTTARKTTTTARKNATATKSAAKGVRTSATKSASAAGTATKDAAKKVGD
jgi:heparin binding hemagglutinin HbhA